MTSGRLVVLLAGGAAALAAAWWLWPRGESESRGHDGAAGSSAAGAEAGAKGTEAASSEEPASDTTRPAAPVRLRSKRSDDHGNAALAEAFESEPRDDEWAARREAEVSARADQMIAAAAADGSSREPVEAGAVECRSRTCRMTLRSTDPAALARALERIGDDRTLHGTAERMMVESLERGAGGPTRVRITLKFAR